MLRELGSQADYAAVQRLAGTVWGFPPAQLPSTFDLQLAAHIGGLTAGAFDGRRLVGFVHGLPRTNLEEPCHHSHMLAVRRGFQGRGLAVRLKLFQRAWCLRRGIGLVTWTYDPLLIRNARLNLVRLRARAVRFLPNHYGVLGGLYGSLPTDRFEVHWRLDSREVAHAARGKAPEFPAAAAIPVVTPGKRGPTLALPIPFEAGGPNPIDPEASRLAQRRLARLAPALFERGYQAVSLSLLEDRAVYVFQKT